MLGDELAVQVDARAMRRAAEPENEIFVARGGGPDELAFVPDPADEAAVEALRAWAVSRVKGEPPHSVERMHGSGLGLRWVEHSRLLG